MYCMVMGHHSKSNFNLTLVISRQPLIEFFWNYVTCIDCMVMGHHATSTFSRSRSYFGRTWTWLGNLTSKLNLGYISATPAGIFPKLCQMYCWVMEHHSRSRSYFGRTWTWLGDLTSKLNLGYISATADGIFKKLCHMYCLVMGH